MAEHDGSPGWGLACSMVRGSPRFLHQNEAAVKGFLTPGFIEVGVARHVGLSLPNSTNGEELLPVIFLQQEPDQKLPSSLLLLLLASISMEWWWKIARDDFS
jgi:hypothetical protein